MLVIRRRAGESVLLGDEIEIEILEVGATQVKIGIRAPQSIAVLRKEILLTGQQNHQAVEEVSVRALDRLLLALQPKLVNK
jgi:carbon storage regulator